MESGNIHVLVVDDEERVVAGLRRALGERGYKVFGAADSREAEHIVGRERVDVALVDWFLGGETGDHVCAALRARRAPPILVGMTGHMGEDLRKRSYRAGAAAHLQKPIDLEEFDLVVRRLCEVRKIGSIPPPGRSPFHFNEDLDQVSVDGTVLMGLSATQQKLLRYLSQNVDRVVTLESVRRHLSLASTHSTQQFLSATKKRMGGHGNLVKTVAGARVVVRSTREEES